MSFNSGRNIASAVIFWPSYGGERGERSTLFNDGPKGRRQKRCAVGRPLGRPSGKTGYGASLTRVDPSRRKCSANRCKACLSYRRFGGLDRSRRAPVHTFKCFNAASALETVALLESSSAWIHSTTPSATSAA